jgi:hypothetical protein
MSAGCFGASSLSFFCLLSMGQSGRAQQAQPEQLEETMMAG